MRSEPASAPDVPLNASLKYNPHLWGPDELRAIFAVRQTELAELVEALTDASPDQVPQHILITGHRGMGKTTLLRRLALSIADTPELAAKWLALTFPEVQYTVRTLAEFWFNVLDALADALSREGVTPAELMALDAQIARLEALAPNQREAAALEVMTAWIDKHHRGLVLLIDSSDQLFASLSSGESSTANGDASATTLWRLRKTLSHQCGLFWIGASYEALESQHLYHDTFHDFFALHELLPLTVDDMRAALLSLARRFGAGKATRGEPAEQEMARILNTRPERLKALRVLTGGNPRATVMLYELFASGGEDSGQSDLKVLLDIMTPLYMARMDALADLPRKLFAHLMENWHPMGVRELAQVSGIVASTLSGQLAKLEAAGLVEKTRLSGKTKRSGYQAAERLFNVWHLMRSGSRRVRQRLAWLVEFMRMWYSRDELDHVATQRIKRHRRGELNDGDSLEYSRAIAAAMGENGLALEWSVMSAVHRESCRTRQAVAKLLPGLLESDGSHAEFKSAADYLARFDALEAKLRLCPHAQGEAASDWVAGLKGLISLSLEDKESVANAAQTLSKWRFEALVNAFKQEETAFQDKRGQTATRKVYEAVRAGDFFPDCQDSKLAFAQLEHCFASDIGAYRFVLDLFSAKHHDTWVEKAYRRAIKLDEKNAWHWNGLGNLLQDHFKRFDEAEAAYHRAIELDEKNAYPWYGLGNLLQDHLKRFDEAEAAYRRAIELNEKNAWHWNGLGNLLQDHLKRFDEAEAAYRRAIELDEKDAYPWYGLGNLLQDHLKRFDEAEAAYRRAIELDEKNAYPWNGLGNLLKNHLKRFDEAEAAYRRAIELDEKNAHPWNGLGNLLQNHLKRFDEAEAAYRRAIELDEKNAHPWNGLGNLLQEHLKRFDEAEAAYRRAIELDEKDAYPWYGLGNLLQDHLKRFDEAEAAYRRAIELDQKNAYPLANLAWLQVTHGNRSDANRNYRKVLEEASTDDDDIHLRLQAHLWLGNRDLAAQALDRLAQTAAAGDASAFFRLREQCWECHPMGLGLPLAELMEACAWEAFLSPFSLALRAAASGEALAGAAPEVLTLAGEVLQELRALPVAIPAQA